MSTEISAFLTWAIWCGAFWTLVFLARNRVVVRGDALRLIVALGLGAIFSHLGTALTEPSRTPAGFSVLFVPLGVLLVALASGSSADRDRFLSLALPALPLAFAVARLGCVLGGCCFGEATRVAWAVRAPEGGNLVHPVALYEVTLLVGLHVLVCATAKRYRPMLALGGIGLIRMALEPIRAHAAGEPLLAASWVALAWLLVATAMLVGQSPVHRKNRPPSLLRFSSGD